jgi:hypothetical protein
MLTQTEKMDLALEAVLLFHSGSPWDDKKRMRWAFLTSSILGPCKQLSAYGTPTGRGWDATTKVLCDMVRAARINTDLTSAPPVPE